MKTVKVAVTQGHINTGSAEDSRRCPVALALRDVLGHCAYVVGPDYVRDVRAGVAYPALTDLPPQVCDFIARYDNLEPCKPFEFEIDLPTP